MIEHPCPGCNKPKLYPDNDPPFWLCSDCYEYLLEDIAVKIDKSYNRKVMNSSETLRDVLNKIYCFPKWSEGWND